LAVRGEEYQCLIIYSSGGEYASSLKAVVPNNRHNTKLRYEM